jgi:hypothetical protein
VTDARIITDSTHGLVMKRCQWRCHKNAAAEAHKIVEAASRTTIQDNNICGDGGDLNA